MSPLHLFEGFGIELEYMLIEQATGRVSPTADVLLREVSGSSVPVADHEDGTIAWSNELVQHVIELKTHGPAPSLRGLAHEFSLRIRRINSLLAHRGVQLLGGGMHPFMDPAHETVLWPHETTEVYHAYDRIFGCKGHGWSNLQSMHINLPFANDEEFGRLHAAIRVALALLPGLAASTPLRDGRASGFHDARMEAYASNSARVPSMAGLVIPEPIQSREQYETEILGRIYADLAPYDPEGLLRHEFANSRGAIARFDRMAIEIRVLDLQEHPAADLAIASVVVALVHALVEERWVSSKALDAIPTTRLAHLFGECVRRGEHARIEDPVLLAALGRTTPSSVGAVWSNLVQELDIELEPELERALSTILREGTLATRMLAQVGQDPDHPSLMELVSTLARCLEEGVSLHAR